MGKLELASSNVGRWFRVLTLLSFAALVACGPDGGPSRTFLTIATGGTGGVYYPLGGALAQIYTTTLPGVVASAQSTVASVFNVQAIERGRVDLAFTQGDVAYVAHTRGTDSHPYPHTRLRSVAVLYVNTVQIVARADGGVASLRDLRGRRVGVGAPASGTEVAARILIEANDLSYHEVRPDFLSFTEVAAQLQDRTVDAGFLVASFPVAALTDVATTIDIRLLSLDEAAMARVAADYPFFKPVTIPAGTYRSQTEPVHTVGVDNLLVCRSDLDDEFVYQLTRTFFESLPELARTHVAARAIDPAEAARSPIPLHPGAERYYRERGFLP